MGNDPVEIDGLPFLKMVIFHGYVTNNQMVFSTDYPVVMTSIAIEHGHCIVDLLIQHVDFP